MEMHPRELAGTSDYSNSVAKTKPLNSHDVCAAVLAFAFTRIQQQNKPHHYDEVKTQDKVLTSQHAISELELAVLAASGFCANKSVHCLLLYVRIYFLLFYSCLHRRYRPNWRKYRAENGINRKN